MGIASTRHGRMGNDGFRLRASLAALVVVAAGAAGAPSAHAAPTGFSGSCDVTGMAEATAPLGLLPERIDYAIVANGTCRGTVDGVRVVDEPVTLRMRVDDHLAGCFTGAGPAVGAFRLDRLGLEVPIRSTSLLAPTVFRSGSSGLGLGYVTAYTRQPEQPPGVLESCLATDLRSFVLQVLVVTVTPLAVQPIAG